MEKPKVRISVRNLVEFILRSGDLDNSRGSSGDKEAMLKGGRLHRKIQRSMKGNYQAEVSLKRESEYEDVIIQVEGRADGIFTEDGEFWIDEIKGTYGNLQAMEVPVTCPPRTGNVLRVDLRRKRRPFPNWDPDDLFPSGYRRHQKVSRNFFHGGT